MRHINSTVRAVAVAIGALSANASSAVNLTEDQYKAAKEIIETEFNAAKAMQDTPPAVPRESLNNH